MHMSGKRAEDILPVCQVPKTIQVFCPIFVQPLSADHDQRVMGQDERWLVCKTLIQEIKLTYRSLTYTR